MTIYAILDTAVTEHENGTGNLPEGAIAITSAEDLAQLKMKDLVELFNVTSPLKKIKRFSTKERAWAEVWKVLPQLANQTRGETLTELYYAQFAGRRIHIRIKKNPRKAHTHAHMFWDKKLKEGMTFEKYIGAGGRVHDLLIDVRLERLELK